MRFFSELSESAIDEFINFINISPFDKVEIPDIVIRKRAGKINWYLISCQILSEDIVREYADRVVWKNFSDLSEASYSFVEEFADRFDWRRITRGGLTDNFIHRFADRIDWGILSASYHTLSESMIVRYEKLLDWKSISKYQKLSEDFIRRFAHRVTWDDIYHSQILSESFIREHAHLVHWNMIAQHQDLSDDFVREFADKIDQALYIHYDIPE